MIEIFVLICVGLAAALVFRDDYKRGWKAGYWDATVNMAKRECDKRGIPYDTPQIVAAMDELKESLDKI